MIISQTYVVFEHAFPPVGRGIRKRSASVEKVSQSRITTVAFLFLLPPGRPISAIRNHPLNLTANAAVSSSKHVEHIQGLAACTTL